MVVYKNKAFKPLDLIAKNAALIGLAITFPALIGSMYYSSVAGYVPCSLCWYQRIVTFPQIVIFAVAAWKDDRNVFNYIMPMALICLAIAVYHYQLQMGVPLDSPCSLTGVSCADSPFKTWGFVTMPLMSAMISMMIVVLGIISNRKVR
jgi:disulfide bond formation protein DsbB